MLRPARVGDPASSSALDRRRAVRPVRLVPMALAVAGLLLTGCGGDGSASPQGPVAAGTGSTGGASTGTGPTRSVPTTPEQRAAASARIRREFRAAPVDHDGERTTASGTVYPDYAGGPPPPAAGRARCDSLVMQQAIKDSIDDLGQPLRELHCRQGYAVAILDLGQCPPAESSDPADRPRCENRKRSYWKSVDGTWELLTYVDEATAGCAVGVVATEPSFPRSLCRR